MRLIRFIHILFFGLLFPCAYSVPSYWFENLNTGDGLSNNRVTCIFKDSEGYMWFGTVQGLNRFDGYSFVSYTHDVNNKNGISHNTIYAITEDSDQNLWIGTKNGLCRLERKTNKFDSYLYTSDFHSRISKSHIRTVYIDENDTIWLGTFGDGLYVFDKRTQLYKRKKLIENEPDDLRINTFYVDSNNDYWIGCENHGLIYYSKKKNIAKHYLNPFGKKENASSFTINKILEYKKNNYLIGTWGHGLYLFDSENEKFKRYANIPGKDNLIGINIIRDIIKDNSNNFWLATYGGGLIKVGLENNKFTTIKNIPHNPKSLSHNVLWCFYMDESDIIWIGTFKNGISKLDLKRNVFNIYQNFEKSNDISAILEDHKGDIWLGTTEDGLYRFNKDNGVFKKHFSSKQTFQINQIIEDKQGNIWLGSRGEIYKVNKGRTGYEKYTCNEEINHYFVIDLLEDYEGNIWAATWGDGIYVIPNDELKHKNTAKASLNHYTYNQNDTLSIRSNIVRCLFEDNKKRIWVGTDNGLQLYNQTINGFYRVLNYNISDIHQDSSGNIWASTFGSGIIKYNPISKQSTSYTVQEGLSEDVIYSFLFETDNIIWYTTNNEICRMNLTNKACNSYSKDYGMLINTFASKGYEKLASGEMTFSGSNGLVIFKPFEIQSDTIQPGILFTDFLIFNKSVTLEKAGLEKALLDKPLNSIEKIKLSYKDRVFSIEFASSNYTNTKNNKFKYKLENFDDKWIETSSSKHRATYTNLHGGNYEFKVKTANNHGIWNGRYKSLFIYIKPPLWETVWFRIAVIMVLICLLFLIYLYRLRSVRRRNLQLKKIVEKRTKEIRKKSEKLVKQTEELNEVNTLLEERQQYIEEQSEELNAKNSLLEEQAEKLTYQNQELKIAYNKVVELNAMKNRFLSIIGHDLKNPINVIMGFSDLLKRRVDGMQKEKRDDYIRNITESARKTYGLLENLLEWARAQNEGYQVNPNNIKVNQLIQNNLILLKESYRAKEIKIKFDSANDIIAFADYNMVDTILRNIISNAIKFTPLDGRIFISSRNNYNNQVVISITDSGIGIPEDKLTDIFRIDKAYNREGTAGESGTGLGLILCKEFVEKNNGMIWAENNEKEGSTFFFTLPQEKVI